MWLRSVFALTLVSLPLSAFARGESSDARKWRTLLPAVRATTDCIARGIAESPPALWHARQENWLEAIKTMEADCSEVGHAMVAEHDRLYGPGTGRTFVGGAYATDLPRALKARIGREIERAPPSLAGGEQAPAVAAPTAEVQEKAPPAPAPSETAAEESISGFTDRPDEATPSAARSDSTADRPDALAGRSN